MKKASKNEFREVRVSIGENELLQAYLKDYYFDTGGFHEIQKK